MGQVLIRLVVGMALLVACSKNHDDQPIDRTLLTDTEVPPAPSRELPPWFGLPDQPSRRIAGQLLRDDAPVPGTVHIRIDAPDPTVWSGIDVQVDKDGRFDFGELRAGMYNVVADAPGQISRVISVDTRTAAVETLSIYIYPCPLSRAFQIRDEHLPAGSRLDLAGVVLGVADSNGDFAICLTSDDAVVNARLAGRAAVSLVSLGDGRLFASEIRPSMHLRGLVLDATGKPVPGIAVQPMRRWNSPRAGTSSFTDGPLQATTDEKGAFVVHSVDPGDADTRRPHDGPAVYFFRTIDRGVVREYPGVVVATKEPRSVVIHLDRGAIVQEEGNPPLAIPSGYVRAAGRVMHAGKPLPDAEIYTLGGTMEDIRKAFPTRSRADGTFELPVSGYDGAARLIVEHPSGLRAVRLITLKNPIEDLSIDIGNRVRIEGAVVDSKGRPIDRVSVRALAPDRQDTKYGGMTAPGEFAVEVEGGHSYELVVSDDLSLEHYRQVIDVPQASVTGLRFTMTGRRTD